MGVDLGELLPSKSVELGHLAGRAIAIDAYNTLYQFLAIIRQPDGTPLMNQRGEVTSHLSGLLYRTSNLVALGIRPVFVFDGAPPEKKAETLAQRFVVRHEAKMKWDEALERGAEEEARGFAQQTSRLTKPMVDEAKALLELMGLPFVQAPAEGEAQAAAMCADGAVWAAGSQDFDSLLFGAPRLLRNMTITGRRKVPRKNIYVDVRPEIIELADVKKELGLSREQLVEIGLMVGTDYNEGVKGIGPKKALAAVKAGKGADDVFREHGLSGDLTQIRDLFLHPDTTRGYELEWDAPDNDGLAKFLVGRHGFSDERVRGAIAKMHSAASVKGSQSRLDMW